MLKASQEALIHQASRDLISIQRKELQHFERILGALFAGFDRKQSEPILCKEKWFESMSHWNRTQFRMTS
jgi:hypothetical protein